MEKLPLFPTELGEHVSKHAAIGTIHRLVELVGMPTCDSTGCSLYGGHSFRTGGAHLLARMGLNPMKIQKLGRWESALVIHYAGEALACDLSKDLIGDQRTCGRAIEQSQLFRDFVTKVSGRLDALEEVAVGIGEG